MRGGAVGTADGGRRWFDQCWTRPIRRGAGQNRGRATRAGLSRRKERGEEGPVCYAKGRKVLKRLGLFYSV